MTPKKIATILFNSVQFHPFNYKHFKLFNFRLDLNKRELFKKYMFIAKIFYLVLVFSCFFFYFHLAYVRKIS